MHQAVEDGIGEGGVADTVVPFFGRQLTGRECGACAVAVFQDFQQVTALLCVQFDQSPVIEDEGLGFRQGVEELGVASVPFGDAQLLEESGQAQVQGGVAGSTGAVRQGTGEPGFADAGGAGDEDIGVFPDPLAGRQ